MNSIISTSPEIPDPSQLDLFSLTTNESPSLPIVNQQVIEIDQRSRDPTTQSPPIIVSGNGDHFELSETQKELSSALYNKSRALVTKNHQATIQEKTNEI